MTMRLLLLVALAGTLAMGACGGGGSAAGDGEGRAIFGEGEVDNTRVVARVDGEPITERMLDLRVEELTPAEKSRFEGPEGRRLLVRKMVDEMLAVRDAEERKLQLQPDVVRAMNVHYRMTMNQAHRNALVADVEPSIDQVREYFEDHRDDYVKLGTMHASHIQCASRARAQEAYEELQRGRAFATVAAEYSENKQSLANGGSLGWFNREGFIPGIVDSDEFTVAIWDLELGVNPPIEHAGQWHVVKVHQRRPQQRQTLDEAYARVEADLLPVLQRDAIDAWLQGAREQADIEYFGEFRPGHGKTARELLERAFYAKDPQKKADILQLLVDDYPDDELTDDALFTLGNLYLDTWGDRRHASLYLTALVRKFPGSDYAPDAQYILENMDKPGFSRPERIEDLQHD
ncbi:hypothetical protein GF314_14255 [bacterium]|nr:hypothetical protein [bacterium]